MNSHAVSFDFLLTELETGLTFANGALSAEPFERDKIERNTREAKKAHNSFLYFRERVPLNSEESLTIGKALDKLTDALRELGESV